MKKQTRSCNPPPIPDGILAQGQHAIVKLTVTETGKVAELHPNSTAPWARFVSSTISIMNCRFRPYLVNGQPVRYEGPFELPTR